MSVSSSQENQQQQQSKLKFVRKKHVNYVATLDKKEKESFEFHVTEHLRMSGIYWGLTAIDILKESNQMDKAKLLEFVLACFHEDGSFGGNVGHDGHLLYTLSAVQILAILNELNKIDRIKVAKYVASLQQKDGSFVGDNWGEVDTRFSYCALNCLSLLGYYGSKMKEIIDVDKAVEFILKCQNFDGGFGAVPGAESHAGQIFCCVGALAIADALEKIDIDTLAWWLCERQTENGGLNGRPEKKADVCYSWWVLSSLAAMDRLHWISKEKLHQFILMCQDEENGGISDKPGNMVDVYHTFFGIAGLSLMEAEPDLKPVDPLFALPVDILANHCGISTRYTQMYCKSFCT